MFAGAPRVMPCSSRASWRGLKLEVIKTYTILRTSQQGSARPTSTACLRLAGCAASTCASRSAASPGAVTHLVAARRANASGSFNNWYAFRSS